MDLSNYFLGQGVLGVVVLTLSLVVKSIYAELKEERKKCETLQEARRIDAAETRNQVTSILPGISQSLDNISDKIEIIHERRRR